MNSFGDRYFPTVNIACSLVPPGLPPTVISSIPILLPSCCASHSPPARPNEVAALPTIDLSPALALSLSGPRSTSHARCCLWGLGGVAHSRQSGVLSVQVVRATGWERGVY